MSAEGDTVKGRLSSLRTHIVYVNGCPNCGGHVEDIRLLKGQACKKCMGEDIPNKNYSPIELLEHLHTKGTLKNLKKMYLVEKNLKEFIEFFRKSIGSSPWSAQRTWARRVLMKKSFSIIAPTGVGKTFFGLVMSLYLASKGYKSYIVVPTTPLVIQAVNKIMNIMEKTGNENIRLLVFHTRLPRKTRMEALEKLREGDFDLLVTTSKFMIKNSSIISNNRFRFVFVDDVDAVLKSGKSILALLKVLGFKEEDIQLATEAIRLRRKLAFEGASRVRDKYEVLSELTKKFKETIALLEKRREKLGVSLIVSSATGRPRGPKVLLFRELLGFQAGSRSEFLRRITDSYLATDGEGIEKNILKLISKLGSGGLIFVPVDKGVDYAEYLAQYLRKNGVKAEAFHSKNQTAIDRFIEKETDILVGVAVYYGVLVRGLDLPWRVRYAIFAGVPRFRFSLKFEDPHPINIFRMLSILLENAPKKVSDRARVYYVNIRRILQKMSPAAIQVLASKLRDKQIQTDTDRVFYEAFLFIKESLGKEEVIKSLMLSKEVVLKEEYGELYIYIPDVMTYIQASGRTSRLYAGGLTKGLSIIVVDDQRLLENLINRTKWIIEDAEWKDFRDLEASGKLEEILREIDSDRENVIKVMEGKIEKEVEDLVKTVLLIVESPNKARTIANFFGKPSIRMIGDMVRAYEVTTGNLLIIITSSGGHMLDLTVDEPIEARERFLYEDFRFGVGVNNYLPQPTFMPFYTTIKKCLVCGSYQTVREIKKCPNCGSELIYDAKQTIDALRELAMEVDEILIGTDPDTEGEKIGWDIAAILRPFSDKVERIEFHEVTRKAIMRALEQKRLLSENLVNAQLVRRIEDRWIGFTLSPILWYDFYEKFCVTETANRYEKKKKKKAEIKIDWEEIRRKCYGQENYYLSAGRVQTPVLGWIIERGKMQKENVKTFYNVSLVEKKNNLKIRLTFNEDELGAKLSKEDLVEKTFVIKVLSEEDKEINPPPPYTTDTLLTEANKYLRLSAQEIMRLAQDLFELGLITYHRTDSTHVSDTGINIAREYLREKFGEKYREIFVPRRWGAEGAHEAIRPTRPLDMDMLSRVIREGELELPRPLTRNHFRLYGLIFQRFIASQSIKAIVVRQKVSIGLPTSKELALERYVSVKSPGFLAFYRNIEIQQKLIEGSYIVEDVKTFSASTISLYTQGEIVAKMKERGIGRPSTYATIVNKIIQRRYVFVSKKQEKLVPTPLGIEVYDYLDMNFRDMVSEERTRTLEEKMDRISEGREDYINVLKELYKEIMDVIIKFPQDIYTIREEV